jgi:hypothetical protein
MWESVMRFHTHHLAERVLQPTSQPLVQGGRTWAYTVMFTTGD